MFSVSDHMKFNGFPVSAWALFVLFLSSIAHASYVPQVSSGSPLGNLDDQWIEVDNSDYMKMSRNLPAFIMPSGLSALNDEEMQTVSGQALFVTDKIVGANTLATGTSGISFYRAGLDARIDLNMNVKQLELGRTSGTAGQVGGVDLLAENVSFGCIANGAGVCTDSQAGGTQLKPVELLRPYFEFAIENDNNPTLRKVVGIRLGAENIKGPISFGAMKVFSGYLSATAQLEMRGMRDVAVTCGADALGMTGPGTISAPYAGGCGPNGLAGTGVNSFSGTHNTNNTNTISVNANQWRYTTSHLLSAGYNGTGGSMGLSNEQVCSFGLCAWMSQLTANFNSAMSPVLNAESNGMRLTQASIANAGLATMIDNAINSLTVEQCTASGLVCAGASWLPGLIRPQAAQRFKNQVCAGLSISPCNNNNLNTATLGYNLTNFHQVEVDSANFGLSFQSRSLRYPGHNMAANMGRGWTMYMEDAFHLFVSEPAGVFTNNIASGAAGAGNLVKLPPSLDNCWGAAVFC